MAGTIKLDGTTFLSKDSSNNFTLDVGSGGSVPTVGTITSGTLGPNVVVPASIGGTLIFLEKYTANNTTSEKIFDLSTHSESFDEYRFVINKLIPTSDNRDLIVRLGSATNNIDSAGGNYHFSGLQQYYSSSAGGNSLYDTSLAAYIIDTGNGAGEGMSGEIKMYGLRNASTYSQVTTYVTSWYYDNSQELYAESGIHKVTQDDKAVSFAIAGSGNWNSGSITAYGVRNA